MNMSKKIIYFICLLNLLFFSTSVFADSCNEYGCATCKYNWNSYILVYDLKSNGKMPISMNFDPDKNPDAPAQGFTITYTFDNKFDSPVFINEENNKIECPKQLYVSSTSDRSTSQTLSISAKKESYYYNPIKLTSESNNGLEVTKAEDDSNQCQWNRKSYAGDRGAQVGPETIVYLTYNDKEYNFTATNGFSVNVKTDEISLSDFANKTCEEIDVTIICTSYGQATCRVTKEVSQLGAPSSGSDIEIGDSQENDNNDKNSQIDVNVKTDPTIVGEGFCEEDSTRRVLSLVGYILIVAKALVPLIIILIGSIDLFKAVMGKDEKDLIKSVKSLGLRLLVGIFIFFVPTIVDVSIDLVRDGHNDNQCVECVLHPNSCR